MCGIAGILQLDDRPAEAIVLQRMTAEIAHRGPDGQGHWDAGPIALGHRRLSIIDLTAAGHQPMESGCGRYVLTYNGEIYNFRELRIELEAKGHKFRSRTDSEVLLEGFAEWGTAVLDRLNGMFAFAIWDKSERVLTLARDRYGIKPLYYAVQGDTFLFASEAKAMLHHPACRSDIDLEGLLEYFTFQNFFTDRTLLRDVRMLPAGHLMQVPLARRANGSGVAAPARYWDFSFEEPTIRKSDREYLEELDGLFQQAVSRQLVSDVDVGAYLSGGMDSGSVTAIAAQQLPYMRTFTCGFDLSSASGIEINFDEREAAERMS